MATRVLSNPSAITGETPRKLGVFLFIYFSYYLFYYIYRHIIAVFGIKSQQNHGR